MKITELKKFVREEFRKAIREGAEEFIGHCKFKDNTLYVDSNLLNKLNSLSLGLDHIGMGDFQTKKPLNLSGVGNVYMQFLRKGETIPGFVGRAHKVVMRNDEDSLVTDKRAYAQLIKIFKQKNLI